MEITKYMKWDALIGKTLAQLRQTASTLMEEMPSRKRYFRSEKVEDMRVESLTKGIWRSTHPRNHKDAREDSGEDSSDEKEAAREKAASEKAASEKAARKAARDEAARDKAAR